LIRSATSLLALITIGQTLYATVSRRLALVDTVLVALLWSAALCVGLILRDGEAGWRALFVLPAVLFTVALVIFPTFFGLFIAFSDWNLQSAGGRSFNGLDNFYQLIADEYFWNALLNMVFYVATVLVQYAIAFGLALLLNADIKAQKFFRVAFLLPFMLSPLRSAG
jgi:multiple sugar transport system permease protein